MTDVLAVAKGELGVKEVPLGSNTGPRVRQYQTATWLTGTNWPWCAGFVCWAYEQAGRKLADRSAGAWDMTARMARRGWKVPLREAKASDIVSFNVGSGHVALFESQQGGLVTTIDGNSQDMVRRAARSASLVRDVIHVPGGEVKPARTPLFQVVTSESGTRKVVASAKTLQGLISKLQKLRKRK